MQGQKMITVTLSCPKTGEEVKFRIRDYVELKNGYPYFIVGRRQILKGLDINSKPELISVRCQQFQILILDKQQTLFGIPCEEC